MIRRVIGSLVLLCVVVSSGAIAFSRNSRGRAKSDLPMARASTLRLVQAAPAAQATQSASRAGTRSAYFGDLHVHTSWSFDAYATGNRNDPRLAYRFGQGEVVTMASGARAQLRVPLDFMAVTDHDISYSDVPLCIDPTNSDYGSPACGELFQPAGPPRAPDVCMTEQTPCYAAGNAARVGYRVQFAWRMAQKNANDFYRPGKFTTFPAYEFTSGIQGQLHRNVIFRGEQLPDTILRAADVKNSPERLWEWLERNCVGDCRVVAIPHNTNWNRGIMLSATSNSDGSAFTTDGLKLRARRETLIEVYQHKGGSECAIGVGTAAEECNFELVLKPCKPGQAIAGEGGAGMPSCQVESQFVRNALKTGLALEGQYGVNPYKYGFIGSTDTHASAPGATDEKYAVGHFNTMDDTPEERRSRRFAEVVSSSRMDLGTEMLWNPGGLAGVWAEENTRASIFEGLMRKETFATSGTRIRIRLFAGWSYSQDLTKHQSF